MQRIVLSRPFATFPPFPPLTFSSRPRRKTVAASDRRRLFASKPDRKSRTVASLLSWRPKADSPEKTLRNVSIEGYVRSTHRLKTETFVQFGDGSSFKDVQAIVPTEMDKSRLLRRATAARLVGDWIPSQNPDAQSHELKVTSIEIVGESDPMDYPIQRKIQTAQFLRTLPHLRSRLPVQTTILRLRSHAVSILNDFFFKRGFIQTHPPIITSSDCEGAGEVFSVTTEKAQPNTKTGETRAAAEEPQRQAQGIETSDSFFRSPKYLSVSAQLHLEALSQSVGNVWTLSPTFRAEKSDTSRHMAEFYMLEAEMSFVDDMTVLMDLVEDMLRYLAVRLRQDTSIYDEILDASGSRVMEKHMLSSAEEVRARWDGMTSKPWPRIRYTDAIKLLKEEEGCFEHKVEWGLPLQAEHERFLAQKVSSREGSCDPTPVFVTHYPRDIKAFYMLESPSADDQGFMIPEPGPTVACFDLLVPDLCEIVGGSMREHRRDQLLVNMERNGLVSSQLSHSGRRKTDGPLDWYADLRRWGSPPHGGFGLGFDRLLAYLTGVQNVKDVVAFPRWWGRCDC